MSPTRRTSWQKHKKMMQNEGYFDSDTGENYRCLIKKYQKDMGRLPKAKKHADMVADSKLKSIRIEIGELNSAKLALQEQGRQVRKMTRQANKDLMFIDEVRKGLEKATFKVDNSRTKIVKHGGDKELVVCLSDIHYGAVVDIPENKYNTKLVPSLLSLYAEKVVELIKKECVKNVHIVNLGDLVEHAYMRAQNLYSAEETLSEQIIHVTEAIINSFLLPISREAKNVFYSAIAGNHDRMQGDKNSSLNADHIVRISNKIVQIYASTTKSNIWYIEAPDYYYKLNIKNRFNFIFVHGDRNSMTKNTTLAELSSLYNTQFNAVIAGHVHHFDMKEVGKNRYQVSFGSIKGIDDYSMRIGASSGRSQGVILVDNNDFDIRKINL